MFTSFGTFTRYQPDFDPAEYGGSTPIFIRNEAGEDFYVLRDTLYEADGPIFVRSDYDAFFTVADGVVSVVSKGPADPTRIFPQNQEFWGYQGPDAFGIAAEMLFDGETLSPAPPPPPVLHVLRASVLYGRMTEDEFDALDDSVLAGETRRAYRAFSTASEFVEDDENWTILVRHLSEIVTAGRLALLMA